MDRFFVDTGPAIVGDQGPPPPIQADPEALAATAANYAFEILGPPLTR
jgi:hypothetical protein